MRAKLQEQDLKKKLITDEWQSGLHFRIQVSLELMKAQSQYPGLCQAQAKQLPMQFCVFTSKSSQDSQKMKSRYHTSSHRKDQMGKDISRGLQQCMRRIPKVLSRGSARFKVKILVMNSKSTERYLKPSKSESGTCLHRGPEKKHLEKFLKANLVRKIEQITQCLSL